ncbi:DUF2058 domain-containing protein [Pseudoxanthomonas wuyuanensis]|uniref:Uncharacterized conserved protein YaiL, DUF2058 family n=1 Tax=Pseudoxanthomonas wuyuanensis TaxID=1073196 RepID=A0A286CXQ5_9GAMM|nr:DUF2058 family protein [Pseudoxanthomonas wuyuanensis]KAF1722622.1 DUF2058 domain-containing protein [Pseudoxanthomonas wuyuanensis]SOD51186.1 Uncharacterized conserved protein YaiL, DUF2058 family [Pseudoxanthomonas wuyuanensis]
MSDSLRDQLLGLGFKPAPKPERQPERKSGPTPGHKPGGRPGRNQENGSGRRQDSRKPGGGSGKPHSPHKAGGNRPARTREEIDLAKAYAIRAQKEKEERIEAERLKQEEARQRREAKAKLEALLKDKALNDPDAEIARHFPYGGKIKRIYVNETQLKALNAGELGVVQQNGRYLLVTAETLAQAEAAFAPSIALKVDPDAPAEEDPYADPQYQVPDDLVW